MENFLILWLGIRWSRRSVICSDALLEDCWCRGSEEASKQLFLTLVSVTVSLSVLFASSLQFACFLLLHLYFVFAPSQPLFLRWLCEPGEHSPEHCVLGCNIRLSLNRCTCNNNMISLLTNTQKIIILIIKSNSKLLNL